MTQLTIFDLLQPDIGDMSQYINAPEPMCYSCIHAIKRGRFRLCRIGKPGYRKIGDWENCKEWKETDG